MEPSDPDDESERRFIERLRDRDERAFLELVQLYQGRVYKLVFRMVGRRDEAEDLAQEVFVQVFKAVGTFRGDSKLGTWVYTIARNLRIDRVSAVWIRLIIERLADRDHDFHHLRVPIRSAFLGPWLEHPEDHEQTHHAHDEIGQREDPLGAFFTDLVGVTFAALGHGLLGEGSTAETRRARRRQKGWI